MSVINKVYAQGVTHTFKDDVSGYGTFSATATLASSATTTRVATVKYRTFNTTNLTFGTTTTIDLYSTSGSASGNNWVASVTGTDLQLNSSSETPVLLDVMPRLTFTNSYLDVIDALTPNILTQQTGGGGVQTNKNYTVNSGSMFVSYPSGNTTVEINVAQGGTITVSTLSSYDRTTLSSQIPGRMENVYSNTAISIVLSSASATLPVGGDTI